MRAKWRLRASAKVAAVAIGLGREKPGHPDLDWRTATVANVLRLDDGDFRIVYALGDADARPGRLADGRGRSLIEAFTALDLAAPDSPGGMPTRPRGRAVRPLLAEFVALFGPVGVDWGLTVEVAAVPAGLRDKVEGAAPPRSLPSLDGLDSPEEFLVAVLSGVGPDRRGSARLERRVRLPNGDAGTRARFDESLPSDRLSLIVEEQRSLEVALDVADAVTTNDDASAKRALSAIPGFLDGPFSLGRQPSYGEMRNDRTGWAQAHEGRWPFGGEWRPNASGSTADWLRLASLWLRLAVDQRLNYTKSSVTLDADRGFAMVERATSLVEVMYRVLIEQLAARPGFGFGRCGYCDGRIVRSRKPGVRQNMWHSGCAASGQRRERRKELAKQRPKPRGSSTAGPA